MYVHLFTCKIYKYGQQYVKTYITKMIVVGRG